MVFIYFFDRFVPKPVKNLKKSEKQKGESGIHQDAKKTRKLFRGPPEAQKNNSPRGRIVHASTYVLLRTNLPIYLDGGSKEED